MEHERVIAFRMFVATSGISVVVISILSLADYFFGVWNLSRWGGVGVPMAINTAICFLIVGSALVVISINEKIWERRSDD